MNITSIVYELIMKNKKYFSLLIASLVFLNIFGVVIPLIIKFIVDDVLFLGNQDIVLFIFLIIVCTLVIESFLTFVSSANNKLLFESLEKNFKLSFIDKILKMKFQKFQCIKTDEYINNYIMDINMLFGFINETIDIIFSTTLSFVLIVSLMLVYNIKLTVLSLLFLPLYIVIVLISGLRMEKLYGSARKFYGEENNEILNVIRCKKSINLFNTEHLLFDRLKNKLTSVSKTILEITFFEGTINIFLYLISNSSLIIIIIYGFKLITEKTMTIGVLVIFYSFTSRLLPIINKYIDYFYNIKRVKCYISNITKIDIDEDADKNKDEIKVDFNTLNIDKLTVRLDSKIIVDDFSMKVKKGEIICMYGKNGSGKTTILNSISKLYTPISGSIKIDNILIDDLANDYYYNNIGYLTQESLLLNDTIYNNITMGKNINKKDISAICERLHILDFILSLENGFGYLVNNNGAEFSGGEKKIILFLRILLRNPKILLLDEFSNDLDSDRKKIIYDCLSNDFKDSIIIMVSHNEAEREIANRNIEIKRLEV